MSALHYLFFHSDVNCPLFHSYFEHIARIAVNRLTEDNLYITHNYFVSILASQEPVTVVEQIASLRDLERFLLASLTYTHLHSPEKFNFEVSAVLIEFQKLTGLMRSSKGKVRVVNNTSCDH